MTEVDLDALFPSLEASAARLNEASDKANQALTAVETRLRSLNLGLEFWYSEPIDRSDSEGEVGPHNTISHYVQTLGLTRVGGKWCLAVKTVRIVDGFYQGDTDSPYQEQLVEGDPTPLLNGSRALRIAALKALPKFLAELQGRVSAAAEDIESTTTALRSTNRPSKQGNHVAPE